MVNVCVLTTLDTTVTGGAQRFLKDIQYATGCRIINPFKERVPKNTEFIIYFDDLSQIFRLVYYKIPYLRYYLTPRRAFYDMYYLSPLKYRMLALLFRPIDRLFVKMFIHNIVCISHTVRNRIYKVYQKHADVIYSPVHADCYYKSAFLGEFWLVVSRVDKWKRIDLIIDAFNKLPDEQVVIVGPVYEEYEHLTESTYPNVRFFGKVEEEYLRRLYAMCKGVICVSIDEDLGLVPLEAHASGKQVIAVNEGGYMETECDILISPTVDNLVTAITNFPPGNKRYNLTKFDFPTFYTRLNQKIQECMK